MDRDALVDLVRRIMAAEGETEEEADRLIALFAANVPHPRAIDLMFYPEREFGPGRDPTPEEIVDRALSYVPRAL